MVIARVVKSRGRQIVVLPKGVRVCASKVYAHRDGDGIVLRERSHK